MSVLVFYVTCNDISVILDGHKCAGGLSVENLHTGVGLVVG